MPWDLLIIKTSDAAPPRRGDVVHGQCLPLGSVGDVRAAIAASHCHVQFIVETLPDGRTRLIADARTCDETSLVYIGAIETDTISALIVEGRNVGNPFPSLRSLCLPNNWAVYEMRSGDPLLSLDQDWRPNFSENDKPLCVLVTREEIKSVLHEWQSGIRTAAEVMSWAKARCTPDLQVNDEEPDSRESVTRDVLEGLELLGVNFILPVDIPAYLRFLDTPVGEFEAGCDALQSHWEAVDYRAREQEMKGVWPYDASADPPSGG